MYNLEKVNTKKNVKKCASKVKCVYAANTFRFTVSLFVSHIDLLLKHKEYKIVNQIVSIKKTHFSMLCNIYIENQGQQTHSLHAFHGSFYELRKL